MMTMKRRRRQQQQQPQHWLRFCLTILVITAALGSITHVEARPWRMTAAAFGVSTSQRPPRSSSSLSPSSSSKPRGVILRVAVSSPQRQRQVPYLISPWMRTNTEPARTTSRTTTGLYLSSSFAADGSEYASMDDPDSGLDDEDLVGGVDGNGAATGALGKDRDRDDIPTIELQPIPLSKNAGNRFVTIIWDSDLDTKNRDALDLHYDRIALTEEHVMYCRKANLYNDTFNTNSMVDVRWSLPILSCDLQRVIGHAMCLESTELHYAHEFLRRDPIVQMLTNHHSSGRGGGTVDDADISQIPFYRWRHIRDYTLRIDDGRNGYPCLCLAMLDDNDHQDRSQPNQLSVGQRRQQVEKDWLQYLIQSERVIAAGPLHLPTQFKDDPSSEPVGDLILFNAMSREHAIEFAEQMPSSLAGLYKSVRVYFYNQLDVTGKFVSEDPLRDAPAHQMKEAMEVWGYPVADNETPWLNF